jgi:hypothetical protein
MIKTFRNLVFSFQCYWIIQVAVSPSPSCNYCEGRYRQFEQVKDPLPPHSDRQATLHCKKG